MCDLLFCRLFFSIAIAQSMDFLQLTTVKGYPWNNASVTVNRMVHRMNELPDQHRSPLPNVSSFPLTDIQKCSLCGMCPMRRQIIIPAITLHAVRQHLHAPPPPPCNSAVGEDALRAGSLEQVAVAAVGTHPRGRTHPAQALRGKIEAYIDYFRYFGDDDGTGMCCIIVPTPIYLPLRSALSS